MFRVAGSCAAVCASTALAICGAVAAAAATAQPARTAAQPARTAAQPARTAAQPARTTDLVWASSQLIIVTNLANAGAGSLRAAIQRADAGSPGLSTVIDFAVHGIIVLASGLPAVSAAVTIDAASAPTYVSGGPPVVGIDCNGHGGLFFAAGSAGSRLLDVAVDDAAGNGITLDAGSITLNGNYIGLDLTGAKFGNHGDGVYISAASARNLIGLNTSGDSGVIANVISGNTGSGIALVGSSGNIVVSNRIGTNAAGTSAIANGGDGIAITGGSVGNHIGGREFVDSATGQANDPTGEEGKVAPVFVVPPLGNLISGNAENGVLISAGSRHNALNGNFVGTTADGDAALGNAGDGVRIVRASGNSLTGCRFVNNPFVYYNVISGNGANGLQITDSNRTLVQGNFFGIGADNTAVVRNRLDGIRIDGSSSDTQVGGVIPLGNVSAGNGRNGIEVAGMARGFVTFNTFGGLFAFKGAAPNGNDGLLITSTGGNNLARTNIFSGNKRNGIELAGHASGVTIDPDLVGLTSNGKSALPNGGDGVLIDGSAHRNVVGGSLRSVIPQNTFSGNAGFGLAILGNAHDNRVISSFIGTALRGLAAVANRKGGILIGGRAHGNSIGAARQVPFNLVSGNTGIGVTLRAGTRANRVIGNYIGLDRLGRYLRNTGRAVVNRGRRNMIRRNRTRPRG